MLTDQIKLTDGTILDNAELGSVDGVTSGLQAQIDAKIPLTQKGAALGVADLDASGKVPQLQMPAAAITDTFVVANQAAMLALTVQTGDVAIRTDLNKSYILQGTDPSILSNWQELLTPTDAVLSVNGQVGAVSLSAVDITNAADVTTANTFTAEQTIREVEIGAWSGNAIFSGMFSKDPTADPSNYMIMSHGGGTYIGSTVAGGNIYLRPGLNDWTNELVVTSTDLTYAGQSIRSQAGRIVAAGLWIAGPFGWTVSKIATGTYQINHNIGVPPVVTVNAESSVQSYTASIAHISNNSFVVRMYIASTATLADVQFGFIAQRL